ncbi:hypothetical protein X738_29830 [Mesorhizobium sp. LNHC209A00]|nr:hypothetical protein X738_29830 [Mesorhizobium sp. LNHC209A00]
MEMHKPFNQASTFRAGNKIDAFVDRQRRRITIGLIARQASEEAADRNT